MARSTAAVEVVAGAAPALARFYFVQALVSMVGIFAQIAENLQKVFCVQTALGCCYAVAAVDGAGAQLVR